MANAYFLEYDGADSPSGKVWSIQVAPDKEGLLVTYGARDKKPRTTWIPTSKFRSQGHPAEMERRVQMKLSEGYHIVASPDEEPSNSAPTSASEIPAVAYVTVEQGLGPQLEGVIFDYIGKRYPNGSGTMALTSGHLEIQGRLPGTGKTELFSVDLMGYEVRRDQQTLGLVSAVMAQHFPDSVSLANASGEAITYLEMAELFERDKDILSQLDIIRVFKAKESVALGGWFF